MFLALVSVALLGQAPEAKKVELTPSEARALKIALNDIETSDGNPSTASLNSLLKLGPKAAPAVLQLITAFEKAAAKDPDAKDDQKPKPRRSPLLGEVEPDRTSARLAFNLALVLGSIGPAASEAYPVLLKAFDAEKSPLTDKRHYIFTADLPLRCRLARSLARVAPVEKHKELAEHLGEALKTRGRVEIESILEGISELAGDGVPAIPGIVARMRHESEPGKGRTDIDKDATKTLVAIGYASVPTLIEEYKERRKSKGNYAHIVNAFGELGPRAKAAAPVLAENGLLDPNPVLRESAAVALGKIGSNDKAVLSGLVEAAKEDESTKVREKAMAALLSTGKPAIPSLVAMFRDDPHNPGYPLAFSFFGPDAKEALPLVLQSLQDKDDRVRIASVLALRSFGDSSPEVIAALREVALKDKSPRASTLAMEATKYLLLPKKPPAARRR